MLNNPPPLPEAGDGPKLPRRRMGADLAPCGALFVIVGRRIRKKLAHVVMAACIVLKTVCPSVRRPVGAAKRKIGHALQQR